MKKRIRAGIERERPMIMALRRARRKFATSQYHDLYLKLESSAVEQIGPLQRIRVSGCSWVPFDFKIHRPAEGG